MFGKMNSQNHAPTGRISPVARFILCAAAVRIWPHPWNFTPAGHGPLWRRQAWQILASVSFSDRAVLRRFVRGISSGSQAHFAADNP